MEVEEEEESEDGDLLQMRMRLAYGLLMNVPLSNRPVMLQERGLADARAAQSPALRRDRMLRPLRTELQLPHQQRRPAVVCANDQLRMGRASREVERQRPSARHFRADSCPTTSPVRVPSPSLRQKSPSRAARKKQRATNRRPRQKRRRR